MTHSIDERSGEFGKNAMKRELNLYSTDTHYINTMD